MSEALPKLAPWRPPSSSPYRSVGVPDDELPTLGDIDRLIDPDGIGPSIFFRLTPARLDERSRIHLDLDAVAEDGRRLPFADRSAPVRAKAEVLLAAGIGDPSFPEGRGTAVNHRAGSASLGLDGPGPRPLNP